MQLHNPAPRIGRDTRLGHGLLLRRVSQDFFESNIWIRAVANRVNWSEERGLLNPIFQRNLILPRLCLYND